MSEEKRINIICPLSDIIIANNCFSLNGMIYNYNYEHNLWDERYGQIIRTDTFQELIDEIRNRVNTFIFHHILINNNITIVNYNKLDTLYRTMIKYNKVCPTVDCDKYLPAKKIVIYKYNIAILEYHNLCYKCHLNR